MTEVTDFLRLVIHLIHRSYYLVPLNKWKPNNFGIITTTGVSTSDI
jgi:hypothetical protein